MVGQRGLDFQVPILESNLSLPDFYLLGGVTGTDFLVRALGCEQPKAHKGVISFGDEAFKTIKYKT